VGWRRRIAGLVAVGLLSTVVVGTGTTGAQTSGQAPTFLTVDPIVLYNDARMVGPFGPVEGNPLSLHVFTVSARLTYNAPWKSVAGELITFTTSTSPLPPSGPPIVCQAITDARGVATCSYGAQPATILLLVLNGLHASYGGNLGAAPSQGFTRQLTLVG
jgi:hypothetical protein